jgi:hypothetical protein
MSERFPQNQLDKNPVNPLILKILIQTFAAQCLNWDFQDSRIHRFSRPKAQESGMLDKNPVNPLILKILIQTFAAKTTTKEKAHDPPTD